MKRLNGFLTAATVAALSLGLGFGAWAQCASETPLSNARGGGQWGIYGTPDDGTGTGSIVTAFWLAGAAESANSGTLPTSSMVRQWESYVWMPRATYSVDANWGLPGVTGGCPSASDHTVFVYSIENQGVGQYLLMSTGADPPGRSPGPGISFPLGFDFGNITNGDDPALPSNVTPVEIPVPSAQPLVPIDQYVTLLPLQVTWNSIPNLKGYFDDDPGRNLITGAVIWYHRGAPKNFRTGAWCVAMGGVLTFGTAGLDPGRATVTVPVTPGVETYLAITPVFDNFVASAFVGKTALVYNYVEPPPSPSPGPRDGNKVPPTALADPSPSAGRATAPAPTQELNGFPRLSGLRSVTPTGSAATQTAGGPQTSTSYTLPAGYVQLLQSPLQDIQIERVVPPEPAVGSTQTAGGPQASTSYTLPAGYVQLLQSPLQDVQIERVVPPTTPAGPTGIPVSAPRK